MNYLLTALALCILAGGCARNTDRESRLDSLVASERAFAAASVEIGNRRAFLEYFADDAVMFRPHPVPARDYLQGRPDDASLLTWRPVFADISRSGDLGYTTGPWEYRADGPEDPRVIHGHYVSVWKTQENGTWKVVIDVGTSNPPPIRPDSEVTASPDQPAAVSGETRGEGGRLALMDRDRAYSIAAGERGMPDAFSIFAAEDIRVYRSGFPPANGKQAAAADLISRDAFVTWDPAEARSALAGDLGYTYGLAHAAAAADSAGARFTYMRIWKKSTGGDWKVVVDVMNPLPESPTDQ